MSPRSDSARSWIGSIVQFGVLFAFWLVMSGEFRPLFLVMGATSAAVVTALTHQLARSMTNHDCVRVGSRLERTGWFLVYLAWLFGSIGVASVQVANFALRPSRPFQPRFIRFRTRMQRPLSRVLLANSITMVPGTMTVRLDGDEYLVHCLIPGASDDLATARMQNMIGRFMGEQPEEPPVFEVGPLIERAVK